MEINKILMAIAIISGAALTSNAQLSLGGHAGLIGNSFTGKGLAVGLRGEYATTDNVAIAGSVTYGLPKTIESTVYANAMNGSDQLTVASEYKISNINVNAEAKRYTFGAEFDDDVAPYFLAGAGLNMYSLSQKVTGEYNRSTHYVPEDTKESVIGFTINFGFGVDIKVGDNYLMFEGKGLIPANEANGTAIAVEIPFSYGLFVGYRIAF